MPDSMEVEQMKAANDSLAAMTRHRTLVQSASDTAWIKNHVAAIEKKLDELINKQLKVK